MVIVLIDWFCYSSIVVLYILFSIVGLLLCPHQLGLEGATDILKLALQDGYVVTLFRDEHLFIHNVFEKHLQDLKTRE